MNESNVGGGKGKKSFLDDHGHGETFEGSTLENYGGGSEGETKVFKTWSIVSD